MKYTIFICKPSKKDQLLSLLKDAGIDRVMCSEVEGYGLSNPLEITYRGEKISITHSSQLKVEIALKDDSLPILYEIVEKVSKGEHSGGGKLFVFPLEDVFHPLTKVHGDEAI